MLGCLEQMRVTTNQFAMLEKDLVTFLGLPEKPSFELSNEFPWLIDATKQIKSMFFDNQIAPQALLD